MNEFFNYTLFRLGEYSLNVSSLVELALLFILALIVLMLIKRALFRSGKIEHARAYSIYTLIKYIVFVISILFALQILGFNLSVLLAGSAALLVGIGFGLQDLFSDFVSGIILLIGSSVKVNDVIEINNMVCRVEEINLRTTTVQTRDHKYIILPNTELTKHQLINWTHNAIASRFEVTVGVDYSSDVKLVMKVLKEAAMAHPAILKDPEPFVRFTDFADSSLNFSIFFSSEEVFRVESIKSEIRVRVFELLQAHQINIPFPQRVVHLKKD